MEEKKKPSRHQPKAGPYLLCSGKKVLKELEDICQAVDELKKTGRPAVLKSKDGTILAYFSALKTPT